MSGVDPRPSPSEDDRLAGELSDLFATAKGGRRVTPSTSPATQAAAPPARGEIPSPPQPAPSATGPEGSAVPPIDVVRLVRYLDAQLKLTRRESRESAEAMLSALEVLEVRLARIEGRMEARPLGSGGEGEEESELAERMGELFDWLHQYSTWEAGELHQISSLVADLAKLLSDAVRLGEL